MKAYRVYKWGSEEFAVVEADSVAELGSAVDARVPMLVFRRENRDVAKFVDWSYWQEVKE